MIISNNQKGTVKVKYGSIWLENKKYIHLKIKTFYKQKTYNTHQ